MRIAELTAFIVEVPLRKEITHASASRRSSTNLVIRCRLEDGTEGWGEGVPRPYVTGETPEGAVEQLQQTQLSHQLELDCSNWSDVIRLCERFTPAPMAVDPRGCHGNALRCTVELSVLDAFGRLFAQPVSAVVEHYQPAQAVRTSLDLVRYSTTITAEGPFAERFSALKMRAFGFAQCKVKVGVQGADDARRLRNIRAWLGARMDLRLDANEAWPADQLVDKVRPLLPFSISSLEQPVRHQEVSRLAELRRQIPVPIMLDESLTSEVDARQAIDGQTCDLFNIRLSKCGGFLSSLRLAALAHDAGLSYQLGCHPGETGILSAAGRHWSTSVRDIRYLEGSYDRFLLRERLTREDLTFGYGGRAPALRQPGLGITVDSLALSRMNQHERVFPILNAT